MSTLATIDDPVRLTARAGTAIGRAAAPAAAPPPVAEPEDDEPAPVKIDRMVSENRARTPAAAAEARRTPRLSIREINELDSEEIRRRLDKIRRDDRSPTEQVLDLIDLPRNAVMQAVAPGLARKAREAGNTGTFGLGKVSASDVLGEMGVENRIVRGVVGFAGDVLLDPLTYVGPAGWGAQLTGKAASVSLRSGGRKALRAGIAEAAAGRAVRDPHVAKYLAAKGLSRLEGEAADIAHSRISKAVYGDLAEGALDKAFVPFGADRIRKGGDFVNDLFDARGGPAAGAARDFYAKYGRGTRGLGPVGGSEVAHIPFTDIGLRTKPFTQEARMATQTQQLAKLRESGLTKAMLTDLRAAGVAPDVMRLVGLQNDVREAEVAYQSKLAEFEARRKAARPDGPDDDGLPPAAGSPDDVPPAPPSPVGPASSTLRPAWKDLPQSEQERMLREMGSRAPEHYEAGYSSETTGTAPSVAPVSASTTPPPTHRDRAIGELHTAFANVPEEERSAAAGLLDAFVKAQARRDGVDPEAIWETFKFQQGTKGMTGKLDQSVFAATRGAFSQQGTKRIIAAMQQPDLSTLVHEMGHAFRTFLPDDELAIVSRIYGDIDWTAPLNKTKAGLNRRAGEERFALDLERYLATGQLPEGIDEATRGTLSSAFTRIKEFLIDLYKNIIGTPLEDQLHPEIKGVFDRMLGGVGVAEAKAKQGIGSYNLADLKHNVKTGAAELLDMKHRRTPTADEASVLHGDEAFGSDEDLGLSTYFPDGVPDDLKDQLSQNELAWFQTNESIDKSGAKRPSNNSSGETDLARMGVDKYLEVLRRQKTDPVKQAFDEVLRGDATIFDPKTRLSAQILDDTGAMRTTVDKPGVRVVYTGEDGEPVVRSFAKQADAREFEKQINQWQAENKIPSDAYVVNATATLKSLPQKIQNVLRKPRAENNTYKFAKIANPHTLEPGASMTIAGRAYTVQDRIDDGLRVLVSDDGKVFELAGIDILPYDPGTLKGAGFGDDAERVYMGGGGSPIEDNLPVTPLWQSSDVPGQEGLFGQARRGTLGGTYGEGGSQGSLFGQGGSPAPSPTGAADDVPVPVRMVNESDAEYKARLALHAKWKESARNTGMLFQGPANPDDARETLAAIDLEQSAFEQAHAAQQQARVDASREVLARAQAAAAAGTGITLPAGIPHELALHAAYYDAVANVRRQESLLEQTELARTLSALNRDEGDSLRQLKLVGDKDIAEDLWSIATSNPEAADNLVGIAQRSVETAALQAEVLHGALSNLLTGPESVLLERTKQLIGTDDAWVAASLFAPLARLAAGRLEEDHWATQALERFDRSIRNSLGVRGGMASRFIARQKAEIRHAGMRLNQVDYAVRDRVTKALRAAGKDNAENRAAMLQIAWAKAHPPEQYNLWKFDARGPQYAADGTILNPSRLTETLNAAKAGGLLTDPGLAKEIDAIVKEFGEAMRTMGDAELAEGILGVQMPGYVPNVATQETRDAAARSKQAFGRETREGESAGEKTFRTAQPFQRQRLTSQTRFKDPNGTLGWRRFFEGDRVWLSGLDDLPREQRISRATETMAEDMQRRYAENPQLAASRTAEKAEAIAAAVDYDELVKANPQFAKDFPLRPTDGMELNELFANNRFDYLVGREKGIENFLETDLAAVWANRTMQHHLARATQQVKDMLRNSFTIDPVWAKNNLNLAGQKGVTSTGVPVEVIKAEGRAGNAVFAAKINGRKYRMLDSDLRTDASEHPLLKSLFADAGNKMDGRLFEEKFADTFEDFVMALRPERQAELLGVVDTIQGFWKMYTLTHASWPIFNVVGNTMLALMGRANPAHMVTHAKDAIRLRTMLGDSDGLKNLTLTIRGQKVTGEDLLKQAVSTGVVNNTISLELAAQYARQEPGLLNAADRYFRRVLAPWFRVNQAADDSVRLMAWMAHMEDGSDPVTAAGKVLDSMFDFSDFTKVEERGFRRIFPFYSWIRSNLGFQLKELVQDPKWAAMAPKLQDAIEEAAAGEDRVPENMRPRWMRDSLAAQLNADPSARIGLMLGQNILPSSDLLNVLAPIFGLDGAQKFMHFLVSSMNQIPVSAFEAASGREIFSGREIGGDTGWSGFALSKARPLGEFGAVGSAAGLGGALAGGALGSLAGPTGAIAGNIAGGLLGSQAGAVATGAIAGNESDTTRLLGGKVGITAGRGSIGQAIARANLGGRVQPMDDERLASSVRREFKDAERKLRLRIGALQRTNQPTTDAMADLMALYRDAIRDGMNDVVPKWAAASLSAGPAPASLAVTG